MGIPFDSAYTALENTKVMQNFKVNECPFALRNSKSLIICKEDGCLCYDKSECPYKSEYRVRFDVQEYRNAALNYCSLLKQIPEELTHKEMSFGTILEDDPKFLVKQLIRARTFGEFRKYLEFLSLEIINAYYSWYLQKADRNVEGK